MSPARADASAPHDDLRHRALRVLFWSIALSLLFNALFGDMGLVQGMRQRRAAARLRAEVRALRAENVRLTSEIDALKRDPYRIEAIAREQLNLSRPGEILFLFQPAPIAPEPEKP